MLTAYWTAETLQLPDQLKAIELETHAVSTERGLISLSYEFQNISACLGWIRSQKDSKL